MVKVIGLTGNIGVGKTTVANYIINNYKFDEYSLAAPLKEIARVFKFEEHQLYGTQEQKLQINKYWGISGREFLQKMGTDVFRDFVPSVLPNLANPWVNLFKIHCTENPSKNILISDVRFPDECQAIHDANGIVIKINRTINKESSEFKHKSETMDLKCDFEINNDGDLPMLYENIKKLLDVYLI